MNEMYHKTTCDIHITVDVSYLRYRQVNEIGQFHHLYHITIGNDGKDAVQLLRRHWKVMELPITLEEYKGDGVLGEQPVIQPGDSYSYYSYAGIKATIGKMWGTYVMENQLTHEQFTVEIPEFNLIVPWLMN